MYNPKLIASDNEYGTMEVLAGEAIAKHDFVNFVGDGKVEAVDAGDPIFGYALEAATAEDETITIVRVVPGMQFLMDNDNVGTTFALTHIGGRFNITGDSGEMLVDTSSVDIAGDGTDHGQLFCLGFNPKGFGMDSDTSIGIYQVAEIQGLGYVTHA
jgi:hypothetical protein